MGSQEQLTPIEPVDRSGITGDFGQQDNIRRRWLSVISPLGILLLWELMSWVGIIDVRFFSRPSLIALTFYELTLSGELLGHVGISLFRVIVGFAAGSIPAILLGLTMGLFPLVRAVAEPIVLALYPIPKLALLPLILLIFGTGESFKIITIALGCFFLVLVNTVAGVVNIEPIYLDVARNFGASRRDFYLTIALPGALPMIFAGLKLGLGVALLLIVAAEMIGAKSGIGYLIWTSYEIFDLEQMYVGLILMMFFGALSNAAMNELENRVVPWKHD